jgi:hypothetical protein
MAGESSSANRYETMKAAVTFGICVMEISGSVFVATPKTLVAFLV